MGEYGFVRVRSEDQKEESRIIALTKPKSLRTRHKVEGNQEGVWQMDHTRTAGDAAQGKAREVSRLSVSERNIAVPHRTELARVYWCPWVQVRYIATGTEVAVSGDRSMGPYFWGTFLLPPVPYK